MRLVERMAEAYWDASGLSIIPKWDSIHPKQQEAVRIGIRAALKAASELSPDDIDACHLEPTQTALKYWRAMLATGAPP